MPSAFIGIGSNMGDKLSFCRRGIAEISRLSDVSITKCSAFYESEPFGINSPSPWFVNAVIEVSTTRDPDSLLKDLLLIETKFGRVREGDRYAPRTLDLDLLLFGNKIINSESLTIPHPKIHLRRFVLEPLAEIAPDAFHPILKKSASELLNEVNDNLEVKKISS